MRYDPKNYLANFYIFIAMMIFSMTSICLKNKMFDNTHVSDLKILNILILQSFLTFLIDFFKISGVNLALTDNDGL